MTTVCHITSVHLPTDVRVFHKQCKTLAAAGYDVKLVAIGSGPDEVVDGVEVIQIAGQKGRLRRIVLSGFQVVRRALREKPAIMQFHDPELLPSALVLALLGRRIIFDFHEDYEKKLLERKWLPLHFRKLARVIFHVFSALGGKLFAAKIAATPAIASVHKARNLEVIANYPLISLSDSPDERLASKASESDPIRLIYTGGWTANRGIYEIVSALPLLDARNVRLTVVGQTEPDELARIRELPGFARIEDKGRVPYEKSIAEMREAHIGLVCSQYGHGYEVALPNKLFEYMALGLPVIASNFPYWRELLEAENCVIFVDPAEPKRIAEAIELLISDPARRQLLGENGKAAIEKRFNWQVEARKLLDLYDEVLSCP